MQYIIVLISALGLALLTGSSALANEYHECEIEYHIEHIAIPGKHTDTGRFRKDITVCVRNIQPHTSRQISGAPA